MKLDKRINKLSDILTCTDIEEAKQFIGQKGYFSDSICTFDNLSAKEVKALTLVYDYDMPFVADDDTHWRYFLPESRLKPVEKEYKPFTPASFEKCYGIGSVIIYRDKKDKNLVYKAVVTSTTQDYMDNEFYIILRGYVYTLNELFKNCEIYEFGEWKPFGVVEE